MKCDIILRVIDEVFISVSNLYTNINILMIRFKRRHRPMNLGYVISINLLFINSYSYRILTNSPWGTMMLLKRIYRKLVNIPSEEYFGYATHYA